MFEKSICFFAKTLDLTGKICYNKRTLQRGVFFDAKNTLQREANLYKILGGAEMGKDKVVLACSECKRRNYNTTKNKKNSPDRLEMNKYCKFCRKHTLHKETK